VAQRVRELELSRQGLAKALEEKTDSGQPPSASFDFLERGLVQTVPQEPFTGSLVAVDGSIVAQELHALDLLLLRSVAVRFDYRNGELCGHEYWPSAMPQPEVWAEHSLQSHEFNWVKNLKRLNSEISCALESAKEFKPQAVLLDGSIVPQVGDRPSQDSGAYPMYQQLVQNFQDLYGWCSENGVLLAGVIKDSRGRHFLGLVKKLYPELAGQFAPAIEATNDTTFLYGFLKPGTRTSAFKYSSSTSEELVLRDLGEYSKRVASFYLRAVELDRPLRVDFLLPPGADQLTIMRAASVVYSLSCNNRAYGYPAALIEADLRAVLEERELEFAYDQLFIKTGWKPDLFKLRRDSRPFR
jgi:hypothetical protein